MYEKIKYVGNLLIEKVRKYKRKIKRVIITMVAIVVLACP